MYTNIAAVMLARAVGAELVLAPVIHRDSFGAHMTDTAWHAAPAETLLEVDAFKEHWRDKGLPIHTVRRAFLARPCRTAGAVSSIRV